MKKDFYVFRHGETDYNRQKRCQGSGKDIDLNDLGKQQALELAEKLRDFPMEAIFSSSLIRAQHTAEAVAKSKNIPVFVKPDLRECFYGVAEGMLLEDIAREYPNVYNNWGNPQFWKIVYPKGESKEDALQRVWKQICKLVDSPYSSMGVAVHAGTMCCLLNYLHFDFDFIPNCAVFHLIYDDSLENKWRVDKFI